MFKSIIVNENNHLKTRLNRFELQKYLKVINLLFLLLLILILTGWYFSGGSVKNYILNKLRPFDQILMNNGFKIEKIIITGTHNLSHDYLQNIINKHNYVNILNVNLTKIHKEIIENSWVKKAYIERVLPHTIKIKIFEKKPIAIWQNTEGNKLITTYGEEISHGKVSSFRNKLPIIKGKKAKENISSILKILNTNKNLAKNIWSLTYINERRWDLHFNQGLIVSLPAQDENKAWQKMVKLQQNFNILNLKLTEIDLRNPDQILGKINFDKKVFLKRKLS